MTNLNALRDLEKRLAEAKGADVNIDRDIHYLGNDGHGPGWLACDKPRYTDSLDAAIALVERVLPNPDWFWRVSTINGGAQARIYDMRDDDPEKEFYGSGKNPALALCLAVVRALIAQGEQ